MNETITVPKNPSVAKRATVRLTTAQALVRYLCGLRTRVEGPQGENRLPVLFLPGDIFVSRDPDLVLQQVEDFSDGTISANDCFRPISRYFDRILQPSQLPEEEGKLEALIREIYESAH